ncbi:MAG: serine O-acetyltransferase [Candidatus Omnitrophota bacterium]
MICLTNVFLVIIGIIAAYFVIAGTLFRKEVKACFERDPAAVNYLEVLLTYSGLHAIIFYRIAHALHKIKVPFLPRFISQLGRFITGIEIHPGATIGKSLFIDHGMGVVIGETSVIGDNVTIFQGATLGGTGKERGKRHPTIGNNAVIGTGAKVLGNITVGESVQVGANAVVIRDVPPNSTVVGVPGRIAKKEGKRIAGINLDHTKLPDPMAQALDRLQHEIDNIEHHMKDWHKKQEEK